MDNLLQILLEAPVTTEDVKGMIKRGYIVSIFYNKTWIKVEPIKIIEDNGAEFLLAYQEGKPNEIYKYEFSKITNWNVLGTRPAKRAAEEIKKLKKDPNRKLTTAIPSEPAGIGKKMTTSEAIIDAIKNRRIVRMYYKGDKENPPGWRIGVYPVCYGKGTGFRSTAGMNYVRAWVSGGKSVSDDIRKEKGKPDPERDLAGWRFFREDRIITWKPEANKNFDSDPGTSKGQPYNPNDKMIKCQARVDFVPGNSKETEQVKENRIIGAIMEAVRVL